MNTTYMTSLGEIEQFDELIKGKTFKGLHFPRIAMVGRSNVGKSTLINALVNTKIADVSKQPGKTRKINFFNWDEEIIIADLPGYGFARRSKQEQAKWQKIISFYLKNDTGLKLILVLLDGRHGPTNLDIQAINFLQENNISFLPVFTKYDALKTQKEKASRNKEVKAFFDQYQLTDKPIWLSSTKKIGIIQLKKQIQSICKD